MMVASSCLVVQTYITYNLLSIILPHALPGGLQGFQTKAFKAEATSGPGYRAVVLKYTSPPGEEVCS